jgi:hypothetical protein
MTGSLEKVEGLFKGLRLSEEEHRGVQIGVKAVGDGGRQEDQAIGKLLADKSAYADAIGQALGPIWCPMKGIDCKDVTPHL